MVIAPSVQACRDSGKAVKVELALERGELSLLEIFGHDHVHKFTRSVDDDCLRAGALCGMVMKV